MHILVDTGILLRLFDAVDPLHATIDIAVKTLRSRGDTLAFGFQNAAEFWNVCTRPASARGGLGIDTSEAGRRLSLVEAGFPLLSEPPALYSIWRQLVVTHSVQGRQVHDARLVALMRVHGISHILTLNGSDFVRFVGINPIHPTSLVPPPP